MSDQENPSAASNSTSTSLSLSRILMVVVPVALVLGGYYISQQGQPETAKKELESKQLTRLLGQTKATGEPLEGWSDADGDLLADSPAEDQCVTPEKILFSYVASSESAEENAAIWQPVLDAIAEKSGIPAECIQFASVDEQLKALADGNLHLTAVNTGAVPQAVKTAGFVPICTYGNDEGFGYKDEPVGKS